jgi:hypothetical protein
VGKAEEEGGEGYWIFSGSVGLEINVLGIREGPGEMSFTDNFFLVDGETEV